MPYPNFSADLPEIYTILKAMNIKIWLKDRENKAENGIANSKKNNIGL